MLEINKIYNMDCLEGMKQISTGSIDIVVCDLPYGTVKNMGIDGWKNKGEDCSWDDRLDIKEMFIQYERVLRENGIIVLFSQEPYTTELRSYNPINIEFAYPMMWKKDHFANALIAKKAPVNYFEDLSVFYKKYDVQKLNPLRKYAKNVMSFIGLSLNEINKQLGHRKAEHFFYIDSTQFKLCAKKVYEELIFKFHIEEMVGFKIYEDLEKINLKYQRVFNLPKGQKIKSNVLEYKKDYQGLHPTQKPVALITDLIETYTNEGDIVLDNCMGSGTTAVACINTNRNYIGFELDEQYYDIAINRINAVS